MERSEIQGSDQSAILLPDCAALHPGYGGDSPTIAPNTHAVTAPAVAVYGS
jgi:hypothetical protein